MSYSDRVTVRAWGPMAAVAGIGLLVFIGAPGPRPKNGLRAELGKPAPAVRLTDVAGQSATLAQYRGRVVLLDFWATWCDSCVDEIGDLKALQQRYRPQGFEILAASVDIEGRRILLPFIAQHSIPWRVLVADAPTQKAFGIFGLPAKFLIDRSGLVARRYDGPVDPDTLDKDIRRLVQAMGGDT